MKRTLMTMLILVAMTTVAATAQAQIKCDVSEVGAVMVATPAGDAFNASGGVKGAVLENCDEALGMMVLAKLPDGAKLVVEATTAKGTSKVATITMFQGIGEIYLESSKDVSDLFPMANLQSLAVRYPQGRGVAAPAPILLEVAF